MMKILYLVHQFYPTYYTGTEKFILQLAQGCQAAGHEVKVVTHDLLRPRAAKPSAAAVFGWRRRQAFKHNLRTGLQKVGIDLLYLRRQLASWLPNRILSRSYVYQNIPVVAFANQQRLTYPGELTHNRHLNVFARELLQREQPDIVHAGHMMRGAAFVQAAAELQIPCLVTLTDFWVICPNCKLITEDQQLCHGPRQGKACQQSCPSQSPL